MNMNEIVVAAGNHSIAYRQPGIINIYKNILSRQDFP